MSVNRNAFQIMMRVKLKSAVIMPFICNNNSKNFTIRDYRNGVLESTALLDKVTNGY